MKKMLLFAAILLPVLSFGKNKTLVIYYSQTGNTKAVAEAIQARTGADIEAIVPVKPYDGDYNATIQRGLEELEAIKAGVYPEIQSLESKIAKYDVIFIGYPVWFGTYAPPVETLLNTVDFKGKKVVPFCTFGSGGLDSSSKNIAAKLTKSEVLPGYGVRAARIDAIDAEVDQFLKAGGFIKGRAVPAGEFSAETPVTEEQAAIFDAAVAGYPMIQAKAETVAARKHFQGGQEYLFSARDARSNAIMKVYVLVEEGKTPVFTQVCR